MADRARTYIDRVRAAHVAFESARLRLLNELQLLDAAGGNQVTDAFLDASGSGQTPELVDMSKAEWQPYKSTLTKLVGGTVYPATTPTNFTAAEMTTLSKGLVPKS